MVEVAKLPSGWRVVRDAATGHPFFKRGWSTLTPFDFAGLPEARTVYREVKKRLDEMDATDVRGPDVWDYAAIDKARLALQISLNTRERWSPELADTGVF